MMGGNERRGGTVAIMAGLLMMVFSGTPLKSAEPMKTAKLVKTFDIPGDVVSLSPSPDGKLIAMSRYASDRKKPLVVWDLATGRQVANLNGDKRMFGRSRTVAFSPDGNFLVAVNSSRTFPSTTYMWDTSTWRVAQRFEKKGVWEGFDLAFSPNGSLLATSNNRDRRLFPSDSAVHLWDTKTGTLKTTFEVGRDDARHVVFSSEGKYLACGVSGHIYVWDTKTFRAHVVTPTKAKFVLPLQFSPDGRILFTRESTDLCMIDTATWRETKRFSVGGTPGNYVACLPKSNHIALYRIRDRKASVVIYDYKTAREVMTVPNIPTRPLSEVERLTGIGHAGVTAIALSANGDFLFVVSNTDLAIWDLRGLGKDAE